MSQTEKLYNLLSDGKPHSTVEILRRVYGGSHLGLARVAARIHDIKRRHNVQMAGWKDQRRKTVYWYQMLNV